MKKVVLMGDLGRKFGKVHYFKIRNVAEAIRALSANFKDFRKYLVEGDKKGIAYQVIIGKENFKDDSELLHPLGDGTTIKFIPIIMGAESGELKFIAGAALIAIGIVVSAFAPVAAPGVAAAWSFAGTAGAALTGIGISLTLSGAIQLLTPLPKSPGISPLEDSKPNYSFSGPVNTNLQGFPVPVAYGRLRVGSAVISAGISIEEPTS